jgi:hypothetical protein
MAVFIYTENRYTANLKNVVLRKSQTLNSKRAESDGDGELLFRAFEWVNNPSALLVVHLISVYYLSC